MSLEVLNQDNEITLVISGDLTVDKANDFNKIICGALGKDLVLDMSKAVTVDTSCMQIIVAAIKHWSGEKGQELSIRNCSALVNDSARLLGVGNLWESVFENQA